MSNRLFDYYRKELDFLYEQGREFSKVHGDEASLLDFSRDEREDPFVRRLVEAFAFLTARVQLKLDDDFPQIATALLESLLPLSTRPFPAFSVVQFEPGDQLKPGGEFLPRLETRLALEQRSDAQFRTCYDTYCHALEIVGCDLTRNFPESRHSFKDDAVSVLKIGLKGSGGLPLDAAMGHSVRFYIADSNIQYELSELIYNPVFRIGIGFQTEQQQFEVAAEELRVLGFDESELVLPATQGLPLEYQLLMELFAYPTKHLFFEILVPEELQQSEENEVDVYLYFKRSNERLESNTGVKSLALNCCPIVNLFSPQPIARPISTYCVDSLVDASSGSMDYEIFDLHSVRGIDEDGMISPVAPFYSVQHHGTKSTGTLFYSSRRDFRAQGDGSDVFISLVDLAMQPAEDSPFSQILIEPLCCNRVFRDLNRVTGDSKSFKVMVGGLVNSANRIGDWNRMLAQGEDTKNYWQLLSVLNLNFLLLSDSRKVDTLQRILGLLDRPENAMNQSWIGSVAKIVNRRVTDRIDSAPWGAVADGTNLVVSLDETRENNVPGSWFLFSFGLNYFFSLHTGVNSFTQLTVTAAEDGRVLTEFQKRCGTKELT